MQYLCGLSHGSLRGGFLYLVFFIDPLVKRRLVPGDRVRSRSMHTRRVPGPAKLLDHRDDRGRERGQAKIGKPQTQIQPISHLFILKLSPWPQ